MTLTEIFKQFKWKISLALSFVLIEKLAWIIEPTVFGNDISRYLRVEND